MIGYSLQHRATDSLTFRQNLQYAREVWDIHNVTPVGLQADLRTLNRSVDVRQYSWDTIAVDNQAELKAVTGPLQHTVLFGVDYRWRQSNEQGSWNGAIGPIDVFAPVYGLPIILSPNNSGSRQTQNSTGTYLQDQIKLDRWILTLGGRYDWAESTTVNTSPGPGLLLPNTNQNNQAFTKRAGLGYEFDSGIVPYISYSESFVPLSGTTYDGTPYKPETGTQYEAGIKYQPKGTNLRMTAAVFDLRRQNVTTPDPVHPGKSIQIGEVSSRGFEFETVASLTNNLNLTAAYTYNDVRVTKSNNADLGKRPSRTPPHLASLWADYTVREGVLNGLGFGGGLRYISASAGDFLNTFEAPAYTLVDDDPLRDRQLAFLRQRFQPVRQILRRGLLRVVAMQRRTWPYPARQGELSLVVDVVCGGDPEDRCHKRPRMGSNTSVRSISQTLLSSGDNNDRAAEIAKERNEIAAPIKRLASPFCEDMPMLTLVKDISDCQHPTPLKRRSEPQPRRSDYNRRRFLGWLRDEVAVLRAVGLRVLEIAERLDIEEHDVRAFCPKPKEKILRRNLSRRAIDALLHGRYASIGGRTVAKRSRYLLEIASAYTWDELLSEPGVGTVTASEIRLWLEERRSHLRNAIEQ